MHKKRNLPCLDFFLLWTTIKAITRKISRASSTAGTAYTKTDGSSVSRLSLLLLSCSSVVGMLSTSELPSVGLVETRTGWVLPTVVEDAGVTAGEGITVAVGNVGDP